MDSSTIAPPGQTPFNPANPAPAQCINLKQKFGRRYKVVYEESYYAEYGGNAYREDPVYMIIPCRWGHIYPAGEETLAASVDGHPKIANQLRRLKCCQIHQDGDFGELTVLFDVADFDQVAKIMRPHRRAQLTEEQKAANVERLKAYWPAKGQTVRDVAALGGLSGHTDVSGAQDDSEPVQHELAPF